MVHNVLNVFESFSSSLNTKLKELESQKEMIEAEYRLSMTSVDKAELSLTLTDKFIEDIKSTLADPETNIADR